MSLIGAGLCSSWSPCLPDVRILASSTALPWWNRRVQKRHGLDFVPNYCSRKCVGIGNITSFSAAGLKFEVRELSKKAANEDVILDGVSFKVKTGAVHALVGPSGSGKTTVLRALNRLWEPSAGSVFYEGIDVTTMDVISLRLQVGMVFQAAALFNGTVADNVKYGPKLRGVDLSTDRVKELLLQAGFSEPSLSLMEKSAKELSGGEAQRVALARALANEPSVLLMDEPTSSLDPSSTRIVEKTVLSLVNDLGLTVVLVSHDLDQVSRVADLATMLGKGGVVLETGTPAELHRSENSVLTHFFTGEQD